MQKHYIFAMINLIIYFFIKTGIFSFEFNFILLGWFFVFIIIQSVFIIKKLKNVELDILGIIFWIIQIIFAWYYLLSMYF